MTLKRRYLHAKTLLARRPILLLALSPIYLLATVALYAYIYNGSPDELYYLFPWTYTVPFTLLTILISILLAMVIALTIERIEEIKLKSAGLGVAGIVIGSLAAGCPGCIFGLFPLLLSLFGVTGTLALLPWNGIEFQILTVGLLLLNLYFLGAETELACKTRPRKKK